MSVFVPWGVRKKSLGWVVQPNGCHIWTGTIDPLGRGQVRVKGKLHYVHRLRYEREVGPVPDGLVLDHFACDNPTCCNPAHVRPATQRENVLRGSSPQAINRAKTHCKRGHELTTENITTTGKKAGERQCLACHRLRVREWAATHPDEVKERRARFRARHRERLNALSREHYHKGRRGE